MTFGKQMRLWNEFLDSSFTLVNIKSLKQSFKNYNQRETSKLPKLISKNRSPQLPNSHSSF